MNIVTTDYETHWASDHSLSVMNPIEYVMHPRTEIISLALKINDQPSVCVFGEDAVRALLNTVNWNEAYLIAHNNEGFDAMISAWRFGIRPRIWGCTLAMARPKFAKTVGLSLAKLVSHFKIGVKDNSALLATKGKYLKDFTAFERREMSIYNCHDTDQCYALFKCLRPLFTTAELWHLDSKIRMLVDVKFDADLPLLRSALIQERNNKRKSLLTLAEMFSQQVNPTGGDMPESEDFLVERIRAVLASAPMFSELLKQRGVEPPMKPSPTNPENMIPALAKTDVEFTRLLDHDDEIVAMAAAARLSVKSTQAETRIEKFIETAEKCEGMLPVPVYYCGADTTGRSSGWLYNMLNLPKLKKDKPKPSDALRTAIMAPPGHVIVVVDASGIEMRVNHFLWNVDYSTRLWKSDAKADIYKPTAAAFYQCDISEVDDAMRQVGKVQQLACVQQGELVLTDVGLVPIEQVTIDMRVWDGVEWVSHEGPIYQGERDVITYQGLTATEDHIVYLRDGSSCEFGVAASEAREIAVTGYGGLPIRAHGDFVARGYPIERKVSHQRAVPSVPGSEVDQPGSSSVRIDGRMSQVQPGAKSTAVARAAADRSQAAVYQPEQSAVQIVRGQGCGVSVRVGEQSGAVGSGEFGTTPRFGTGSAGEQRPLRGRKSSVAAEANQPSESGHVLSYQDVGVPVVVSDYPVRRQHAQASDSPGADVRADSGTLGPAVVQTKRRVWDLLNAGPRHRFTVQGLLVSNCGFGCGHVRYVDMARTQGGLILELEESRAQVNSWREMTPEIADYKEGGWARMQTALSWIVQGIERPIDPRGLLETRPEGILLVGSKRLVRYPDLRYQKVMRKDMTTGRLRDEDTWLYGLKRHQTYIYGAKADENVVQALARDVVYDAALAIFKRTGYRPALEVYDELVYVVPEYQGEKHIAICHEEMRRPPVWWQDLVLWSEGDIGQRYSAAK